MLFLAWAKEGGRQPWRNWRVLPLFASKLDSKFSGLPCCRKTAATEEACRATPALGSPSVPALGSGTVNGVYSRGADTQDGDSEMFLTSSVSFLRGLVVLSPERSYTLELRPEDLQGPVTVSRIQDLLLPGHTCAPSWHALVPTQAGPDLLLRQQHIHRVRRHGRSTGPTSAQFTGTVASADSAVLCVACGVNTAPFVLPIAS